MDVDQGQDDLLERALLLSRFRAVAGHALAAGWTLDELYRELAAVGEADTRRRAQVPAPRRRLWVVRP